MCFRNGADGTVNGGHAGASTKGAANDSASDCSLSGVLSGGVQVGEGRPAVAVSADTVDIDGAGFPAPSLTSHSHVSPSLCLSFLLCKVRIIGAPIS